MDPVRRCADQSSLTPEDFTIAPHFCVSSAMKAAKSCAEPISASALSLARVEPIYGEFKPWLIAALSLVTTAVGVPAGAMIPVHE